MPSTGKGRCRNNSRIFGGDMWSDDGMKLVAFAEKEDSARMKSALIERCTRESIGNDNVEEQRTEETGQ
jgi:hypothetical protein